MQRDNIYTYCTPEVLAPSYPVVKCSNCICLSSHHQDDFLSKISCSEITEIRFIYRKNLYIFKAVIQRIIYMDIRKQILKYLMHRFHSNFVSDNAEILFQSIILKAKCTSLYKYTYIILISFFLTHRIISICRDVWQKKKK